MITPIKNAPIRFIDTTINEKTLAEQEASGCYRKKMPFEQLYQCDDEINFQVLVGNTDVLVWGIMDAATGEFLFLDDSEGHVTYNFAHTVAWITFHFEDIIPASCNGVCYKLFIASGGTLVNNLFTDGDVGTMESTVNGFLKIQHDKSQDSFVRSGSLSTKSMKLTYDGAGTGGEYIRTGADYSLELGKTYTTKCWIYVPSEGLTMVNGHSIRITYSLVSSVDTIIKEWTFGTDPTDTWFELETRSVPNATASSRFELDASLGVPENVPVIYVDTVVLAESSGFSNTIEGIAGATSAFVSEPLSIATTHDCTLLMKWFNDEDAFGFEYTSFLQGYAGFTHNLRISAKLGNPSYTKDKTNFVFSDGEKRILYSVTDKAFELYTDYLPEYIHDALSIALEHDHYFIQNEEVSNELLEYVSEDGEYEPEWEDELLLAKVRTTILKKFPDNRRENSNC